MFYNYTEMYLWMLYSIAYNNEMLDKQYWTNNRKINKC